MKQKLLILVVFSIAMGFLEGAVVVYLRALLYPNGFSFPLTPIPDRIAFTELIREAATIIMLGTIAFISGTGKYSRWAFFLIAFAVWDLTYYLALKLILDWPASFFTWDILFLIPVPWIGPVIAPCLIAVLMIVFASLILKKEYNGITTQIPIKSFLFFMVGICIVLFSFMQDYISLMVHNGIASAVWTPGSTLKLFDIISTYVPQHFDWWIFNSGFILMLIGTFLYAKKPS